MRLCVKRSVDRKELHFAGVDLEKMVKQRLLSEMAAHLIDHEGFITREQDLRGGLVFTYEIDIVALGETEHIKQKSLEAARKTAREEVDAELRRLHAVNVALRDALKESRETLEKANKAGGPIADTIWHGPCETLFDFMDAAITKAEAA